MRARASAALIGVALLTLLPAAVPAAAGASGWGRPFRLAPPYATDLTAIGLAMSSRGDAAAAFSVQDEDIPATSDPFVAIRAAGGSVSAPFAVPGAQLVLDLAYDRSGLRLLTGTSESGKACCSTVQALSLLHDGRFGRPLTIAGKLAGATLGSLTPLPSGRLLATVGTDRGVWVAQSRPGGGFGPTHRLSAAAAMPWTVATTADAHGDTTVAWTATQGQQGEVAPSQIVAARGSERAAPGNAHPAFTAGGGHQIDEIGLAPSSSGATAAWTESWFDKRGIYHAQTVAADLGAGGSPRTFSVKGEAASSVAIAGGARGDDVVAWRSCTAAGACVVRAAVRPAGGRFAGSQRLGAIDPGQAPAVAVSRDGDALVGWISGGHVLAAERRPGRGGLGPARIVSSTSYAAGLTIAFGSTGRQALAAWTQGTLAPDVVGTVFRG